MCTESDVRQRHALFTALARFAGAPALLLDSEGRFEAANSHACELLECSGEPELRERWPSIGALFPISIDATEAGHARLVNAIVPVGARRALMGLEIHALERDIGGGWFALLKDRSVLDHLERELMLASECRGWMHQGALLTHDLKGILNSMQISLELLTDAGPVAGNETPEESRRQRRVASLKEDLARMNAALRSMPGAERESDPVVELFDARDMVRDVMGTLRLLARRNNVEVKSELPDSPVSIRAKRAWVRQALFNVALHRLNAMRAGGRLVVSIAAESGSALVRVGNDAPDLQSAGAEESDRRFCAGRRSAGNTDLLVARAICESAGGDLRIGAGAGSSGSLVELRLPG